MHDGCPIYPYRVFGVILCLLSAGAFGLGIADVVIGIVGYYQPLDCSSSASDVCTSNALRLTWVGVGIWASIPLFITGIVAIFLRHNERSRHRLLFFILCFLSVALFAPAMSLISAFEVWQGTGVFYNIPVYEDGALQSDRSSSDTVKLSVSLTIAVIGAVLMVLLLTAFVWHCCCCGPCVEGPSQGSSIRTAELNAPLGGTTLQSSDTPYAYDNEISAVNTIMITGRPNSRNACNGHAGNCQHMCVDHQTACSSCHNSPPSFVSSVTCHNTGPQAVVYSTSANEAPPGIAYSNSHFGHSTHDYRWSWRK